MILLDILCRLDSLEFLSADNLRCSISLKFHYPVWRCNLYPSIKKLTVKAYDVK